MNAIFSEGCICAGPFGKHCDGREYYRSLTYVVRDSCKQSITSLFGNWYRAANEKETLIVSMQSEMLWLRGDYMDVMLLCDFNFDDTRWLLFFISSTCIGNVRGETNKKQELN